MIASSRRLHGCGQSRNEVADAKSQVSVSLSGERSYCPSTTLVLDPPRVIASILSLPSLVVDSTAVPSNRLSLCSRVAGT